MSTLADLKPGAQARVTGFREQGPIVQRLMALGVIEGADVRYVRNAPAGDPIEIEVMGYALSLRRREAALVDVSSTATEDSTT